MAPLSAASGARAAVGMARHPLARCRPATSPTSTSRPSPLSPVSPFVTARLAPRISRSAWVSRSGGAAAGFGQQQLRLLTSSRPFLAPNPSNPAKADASSSSSSSPSAATAKDVALADEKKGAVAKKDSSKEKGTRMQRIWAVVKKEALHYYHGARLLGKETRISARLLRRLIAGKKLTRREHRQVRRIQTLGSVLQEKLTYGPAPTAEAYHDRPPSLDPVLRLCPHPVHGVAPPGCAQAVPEHAALDLH